MQVLDVWFAMPTGLKLGGNGQESVYFGHDIPHPPLLELSGWSHAHFPAVCEKGLGLNRPKVGASAPIGVCQEVGGRLSLRGTLKSDLRMW